METLELPDIQGVIVRGYHMPTVRYLVLNVVDPAAARAVLGRLTSGDESDAPQITTAEDWHVATPGPADDPASAPKRKPDYCLNVGMTWPGLAALGVTDQVPPIPAGSFDAFVEGAAQRAERVGDHGDSGPEHWVGGLGTGEDHVMVGLYALTPELRESYGEQLTTLFKEDDAFEVLSQFDGAAMIEEVDGQPMPVPRTHFGYTDGITVTPPILGGPEPVAPDHQVQCDPGLFVLSDDASSYNLPSPQALWRNGKLRRLQDDRAGRRRVRELPPGEQGPDRPGAARCQDLRPLAQRRAPGALTGDRHASRRHRPGSAQRLRLRQPRRFGRPRRAALSGGGTHPPRQPAGPTGPGPGSTRREQQRPPADSPRHAVRPAVRPRCPLRRCRARPAGLLHQHLHREPVRVRAAGVGGGRLVRGPDQAEPGFEGCPHRFQRSGREHLRDPPGRWPSPEADRVLEVHHHQGGGVLLPAEHDGPEVDRRGHARRRSADGVGLDELVRR